MTQLLERLQRQVVRGFAAGSEIHDGLAFRVHIWRNADVFYRNRALAMRRPVEWAAAIDEMVSIFAAADRVPRIELFAELWPDLAPALEQAGWVCEAEAPVLALSARHFKTVPTAGTVTLLQQGTPRSLVRDFIHAAEAVFDMAESAEIGSEVDVLVRDLASGDTICAASMVDGRPVSGASLIGVATEAELAGVWTLADARRQGRAETVCRSLLGHFFDQGGEVAWLSAGDSRSERLYRRLGFITVGTQLNYAKLSDAKLHPAKVWAEA